MVCLTKASTWPIHLAFTESSGLHLSLSVLSLDDYHHSMSCSRTTLIRKPKKLSVTHSLFASHTCWIGLKEQLLDYVLYRTHSLSAYDLGHSFHPCMRVMTYDLVGGSREIDVSSSLLQFPWWVGELLGNYISCALFTITGHAWSDCS